MLGDYSIIKETAIDSTTQSSSTLQPKGQKGKKKLTASLMLTSLVDAFSILMIFLLMNFSASEEFIFLNKDTSLPEAAQILELEKNTVVRIENEKIFIGEDELDESGLIAKLIEIRKEWAEAAQAVEGQEEVLPDPGVTIQADRSIEYEYLNKVVLASNHAGFSDIHFVVLRK